MISDNKTQHLGRIYQLVEQFEVISRTDLAKLSTFAPASVTSLTKSLIEHKFVIERSVQNCTTRGRPAIGLAVSSFFWQLICITISPNHIVISLCELNGKALKIQRYPLEHNQYPYLAEYLSRCVKQFLVFPFDEKRLLAVSVSVIGQINAEKTAITQLEETMLNSDVTTPLHHHFSCPILLNEHFQSWLLTESTLGSLIGKDDVIFLQLDEYLNLGVLLQGNLLHKKGKMNIDKMLMPDFGELSRVAAPEGCQNESCAQISNQVTFSALTRLIDHYLPNELPHSSEKIKYLCDLIQDEQPQALKILQHIAKNLGYLFMNLHYLFPTNKIMLNSPLLRVKKQLFDYIQGYCPEHLDLVTSQYTWDDPIIACAAIKQEIYNGNLIKDIISLS